MIEDVYFGAGRIYQELGEGEHLPLRFSITPEGAYTVATEMRCDFSKLGWIYEQAERFSPQHADYTPHMNAKIDSKLMADIVGIWRAIKVEKPRNCSDTTVLMAQEKLGARYKTIPLSVLYREQVMRGMEWSAVATHWLRKKKHQADLISAHIHREGDQTKQALGALVAIPGKAQTILFNPDSTALNGLVKVPAVYTADADIWARFATQGSTANAWIALKSVWTGAPATETLHVGFAPNGLKQTMEAGLIKPAETKASQGNKADCRQLKLL